MEVTSQYALRRASSAPPGGVRTPEELEDLQHWRSREIHGQPSEEQMLRQQPEVNAVHRWVLMDWLAEVRDEYRLTAETLFLACNYLDRYLCAKPVSRNRLQLVGLACLWVAAKYEEVRPPSARDMLAMAADTYTGEEIKAMEREILFTLGFELACPTSLRFLHYFLLLAPLPSGQDEAYNVRRLAEALLDLTLLDTAYLRAPRSVVAAATLYLALGITGNLSGLPAALALSHTDAAVLGDLVKDLYSTLARVVNQDDREPCALLGRYHAWQRWAAARASTMDVDDVAPAAVAPPPPPPPMAAALAAPAALAVAVGVTAHVYLVGGAAAVGCSARGSDGCPPARSAMPLERCIANIPPSSAAGGCNNHQHTSCHSTPGATLPSIPATACF